MARSKSPLENGGAPARGNATVFEVAKLADVSIATVSRALNNPDSVREELRARVVAAARQLGYASNPAAKALRARRSRIIATVVPTLDDEAFSRIVNGLQSVLVERGYVGFLHTSGFDNSNLHAGVKQLFERGAEAMAIVGRVYDKKLLAYLSERNIPSVSIYSRLQDDPLPSIGIDNYKATQKLVDLLLDLGHRRIAMIAGTTKGNDRQQVRIKAFRERMREMSLEAVVHSIERNYTLNDGADAIREICARRPDITAVLCGSHIIAFGVLAECRRIGIDVPGRLSVTGFDDFSFAPLLDPPLTTLSVPASEIGRRAAEALIAALDEGRPIHSLEFETGLIVRASTAALSEGRDD